MPYQLTVQRNPNTLNVKDFGAVGDGVHDDTANINAALLAAHALGGGTVTTSPGASHLISAPLVIYSNTKIIFDVSNIITLAPNSNCNMIRNASITPQRSVTDAAITSGLTTLTSATANFTSTDVGRTVGVTGAWNGGYILIATIVTVTNSTTVTVSVAASATVSGANCAIYNRDTNIEIAGGYWQRGANGYTGGASQANRQTMLLRHIDNLSIHDLACATTNKAYYLALGDVTNFHVKHITYTTPNTVTNTDGVAITGPAQYGLVDAIYGTTGDDFVSLHGIDGDGTQQDVVGNISDIVVSNLFPNLVGQGPYLQECPSGTKIRSVTVRGVHGSCLTAGISIYDDSSDILIEDVNLLTNGESLVWINTTNSAGSITLKDLVWRQVSSSGHIVDVLSGTALGCLTVDGMDIEVDTGYPFGLRLEGDVTTVLLQNVRKPDPAVTIAALLEIGSGINCSTAIIRNCSLIMPATSQNTVLSNQGSLKVAMLDNLYLYNGGIPFVQKNGYAFNCQCIMSNVTLDGSYQLAQVQVGSTADFLISNLNVLSILQSQLVAITGTGANMSVSGKGLVNPNAYPAFSRDGTQKPRINHSEMLADLSQLTPRDQDMVNNSNSGLSSGTGICIFSIGGTGNGWLNLYSANTY